MTPEKKEIALVKTQGDLYAVIADKLPKLPRMYPPVAVKKMNKYNGRKNNQ